MLLDLLFIIIILLALYRGYQQGLIVGLFSLLAIIIGLAAAIKLSAIVALKLGNTIKIPQQWLPLVSFVAVFVLVVLLVRLGARLIEGAVRAVMLGWLNRLGGMIFYTAIYLLVYSVLLFYLTRMELLNKDATAASFSYSFIAPRGPEVMDALGSVFPGFKDMFHELESFFERVSHQWQGG